MNDYDIVKTFFDVRDLMYYLGFSVVFYKDAFHIVDNDSRVVSTVNTVTDLQHFVDNVQGKQQ